MHSGTTVTSTRKRDLTAQGVDIDLEAEHLQYGGTALACAYDRGHTGRESSDQRGRSGRQGGGRTALMWACEKGRSKCVRALIDVGATVDKVSLSARRRWPGKTALMWACDKDRANFDRCAGQRRADEP